MVKITKLKIIKPIAPIDNWKEFNKILEEIQEEVRIASNRVMTACNIKYSEIMCGADKNTALNGFGNQLYAIAKDSCPSLMVKNMNDISNQIYKRYFTGKNSYMNMMKKGDGNPPMSFTKKPPIPIADKRRIKIMFDDNGFTNIAISLTSTEFKKKWNEKHPNNPMKNGMFTLAIDASNKSIRSIIERCASSEYEMCGSKLVSNEKGTFIHLAYQFDCAKPKHLNPNRICGIDMGMKYAAVCAISDMDNRKLFINGETIIQDCIKLRIKRNKAQKLAKYNINDGHGRKPKTNLSSGIKNKQSNYRSTVNRKYAKDIVDFAYKNECGEIRIEDLKYIKSNNKKDKFLNDWTYYQLQEYIEQKANAYGINVVKVKPRDTSRRCSKCGYIDSENRLSQSEFVCKKCGFSENADLNAARNIATWAEVSKK